LESDTCCGKKSLVPIEGGVPRTAKITLTKMVHKENDEKTKKDFSETIPFWPWKCVNCGAVFYFPRSLEVVYDAYSKPAERVVIVFDEDPPV